MKVVNVRAGFATNSSSSHSVILVNPMVYPNGISGQEIPSDPAFADGLMFGWEQFLLTTPESKMEYFAAQLVVNFERILGDNPAIYNLVYDLTGIDVSNYTAKSPFSGEEFIDANVDHQSVWGLSGLDLRDPDVQSFLTELGGYIRRDDIAIQGGNDNDDNEPLLEGTNPEVFGFLDNSSRSDRVLRKDGEYYTIFDRDSGTKVRFSFNDDAAPYTKAATPELVDIKITDYCPMGCSFCYQSSTKAGVHASLDSIRKYANTLKKLKVFEVAIGGGEPTMHPDFPKILKIFKNRGIQPNFTTYSVAWLRDEQIMQAVNECQPAIGVSVHNEKDIKKFQKIREAIDYDSFFNPRVMAQHVVGSLPSGETCQLLVSLWEERAPVLLLGFKQVGFGAVSEPHDMKGLGDLLVLAARGEKKFWGASMASLSVDTAFTERYAEILNDMGVQYELVASPEGKFSMYIDAVTKRVGPSSYVPQSDLVPLNTIGTREVLRHWKNW